MARNSIIKAVITADTKGFDSAIGRSDTAFGNFGRNATLALGGLTASLTAAVAVATPLVNAASDWEEAASRVDTIFGDAAASVRAFSETSAESFAVSGTEALSAAGDFAGFFDSLAGDELSDISTGLVEAAADFASFNNLSTDEALGKFTSALAGSSEVMRRYGIDTTETAVAARALEMGLGNANGELTEQEKNLARAAILLDENNTFMGDFGRTSDSLANQQKELQARFSDVQVELGQKLLPVALAVAEVALDLIDGFSEVIEVFGEEGLSGVLDMVSDKFEQFDTIRAVVGAVVGYIAEQIGHAITVLDGIIDFIRAVFTGEWGDAWNAVKQIFEGMWNALVTYLEGLWNVFKAAAAKIGQAILSGLVSGLSNLGNALWGFIKAGWDFAVEKFRQLNPINLAEKIPLVGDLIGNTIGGSIGAEAKNWMSGGKLPAMAAGGIVTGPTLALIGEAGPEAVVPLSGRNAGRYGFGGAQMVHVTLQVDGRVLAEVVRDADADIGFVA